MEGRKIVKKATSFLSSWLCCLLVILAFPTWSFSESASDDLAFQFEGVASVTDNPWGVTAGVIEDENIGSCIYLTPNTAVYLSGFEHAKSVTIHPCIHQAVADSTDGAGLLIWTLDKENSILDQRDILIVPDCNASIEIPLPENAERIKILCNNGNADDDCGDWVIISLHSIQLNRPVDITAVSFENTHSTDDNPWGVTAGYINDNTQSLFFLTPNTRAAIEVDKAGVLTFETKIHPAVASVSDGAGLLIWLLDDEGNILGSKEVLVSTSQIGSQIYELYITDGTVQVLFSCNNGVNNDDSGDWVVIQLQPIDSSFGKDEYVCSATYAGNEWVINFWNSEMDHLKSDLQQIKRDGFNSIIICIPWKEFQISTDPVEYNNYAFEKLNHVMMEASDAGLDVYTRIGYTWDYFNDNDEYIFDRYIGLLSNQTMLNAWKEYAQIIYQQLCDYDNFAGAFLTWEDFWGILAICDKDDDNRLMYSITSGYQEYAADKYTINEYNAEYGTSYRTFDEVMIPRRDAPDMWLMYEFFDTFLCNLLKDTQSVFPNISMEVRLDADPVTKDDGDKVFYSHDKTYGCEASDFTATMYSIPMGFENVGERVSASEALQHTDYILSNLLCNNGGKPVFVEQFLFNDNTPQFYYNAQIRSDEVDDYLNMTAEILHKYTRGYGIWTYRDYRNNMIYNPQFALEEKGWDIRGSIEFERINGSIACHIRAGDVLQQKIGIIRDHFPSDEYTLQFEITQCNNPGRLSIRIGEQVKTIEIKEAALIELAFNRGDSFDLSFEVECGEFYLDNLVLYSFIQEGNLYDVTGQEMEYISNIRNLNAQLLMLDRDGTQ